MIEVLTYLGYSAIGYAFMKLWKISRTSIVIDVSKMKALEERIREDERSKINVQ